ncbi:helix-turn-helix domain-containing protein [Pusillimonas sp.]|uniref:helix-turn-helix domain-containing protein n=1 Tax=Pusillimonas sp. TaxID=3040095 RepID=UPI0037C6FAB3
MDEKLRFVSRYLDGESIASLCREFGISRVTGHTIINRYKEMAKTDVCTAAVPIGAAIQYS